MKKPRIVIIVQARMGSTRLPGKVLKEILGKPLIGYELERLQRVQHADKIVVATTTNANDDLLAHFCQEQGIAMFRGSEEDVLTRYLDAAQTHSADIIVRISGDCPLIDPEIVDQVIFFFLEHQNEYDYVSNVVERTFPRGMDVEVFSAKALFDLSKKAKEKAAREHVTLYFYEHPKEYRIGSFKRDKDESALRLTVDTTQDFQLVKNIIEELFPVNPQFSLKDILQLLETHPEWKNINAEIKQKDVRAT